MGGSDPERVLEAMAMSAAAEGAEQMVFVGHESAEWWPTAGVDCDDDYEWTYLDTPPALAVAAVRMTGHLNGRRWRLLAIESPSVE